MITLLANNSPTDYIIYSICPYNLNKFNVAVVKR
jgi:hypothetical protein